MKTYLCYIFSVALCLILIFSFAGCAMPTYVCEIIDDADPFEINDGDVAKYNVVNKNAPADQQAVAQDIVRYFFANDELEKEFCMANSVFPAKVSLQSDADLLASPSIAVLADHIDRYIWPGPMPSTLEDNMKIALEEIFYNGKDIDTALADCEAAINEDLATLDFESREPLYKYAK